MYGTISKLSDLARAEIDALHADGIELNADEVVELNAICQMIETPALRMELAAGVPVEVGNGKLWPLTIYGSNWYMRHEREFKSDADKLLALAYCMAYGRDELPESDVRKAVKAWRNTLKCRMREIQAAVGLVLEQDEQPDTGDEPAGASFGNLSALLVAHCGGEPRMWERLCSLRYSATILSMQLAKDREEDTTKANKLEYEKALAQFVWEKRNG